MTMTSWSSTVEEDQVDHQSLRDLTVAEASVAVMHYELAAGDVHSEELKGMADSLDEVRGCLKAAIGWKSLSEEDRRDLLLRALKNADTANQTLLRLDTKIDLTE